MTEKTTFELAKQGDPGAIATMLQKILKPIGVQVSPLDDKFQFLLEGTLPSQATAVELLEHWLATFGKVTMTRVVLGAVPHHDGQVVWLQVINLCPSHDGQKTDSLESGLVEKLYQD